MKSAACFQRPCRTRRCRLLIRRTPPYNSAIWGLTLSVLAMLVCCGCANQRRIAQAYSSPAPQPTLGAITDQIHEIQEGNAERSDFVVYDHEWLPNSDRLNTFGKDHLLQIAWRLSHGGGQSSVGVTGNDDFLVVVERSRTTVDVRTRFKYPVHLNRELDLQRREVLVRSLQALGIEHADEIVVISEAYAPGEKATVTEVQLNRALNDFSNAGVGGIGGGGF